MRYRNATQWGVYDVEVKDGQIVDVFAIDEDPDPAEIRHTLRDGVQHSSRIKSPAIRRGWLEGTDSKNSLRGADEFVDVSWDVALGYAAKELNRVKETYGNRSIFAGSYGWASAGRFHHAQSQLHRFINFMGGCTRAMNSYSTAAAQVILPHVIAPWGQMELEQTSLEDVVDNTELFIAFGGLPSRNAQVAYGGITEHRTAIDLQRAHKTGTQFVNISPVRHDVADDLDPRWIVPRPGTDVAVMLGMAYVLETQNLADRAFLASHCVGYEQFQSYLLGQTDGQAKTPQWAAEISSVSASTIESLAIEAAGKRTFLTAAWSLQRADHGEQPYWMLVTLAAMLGQVGLTGGGVGFGYSAEGFVGSNWRRFNWATVSKGKNPADFAIPVARIADMLLNPGETISYDGGDISFPDTRLIYWAGGNPFHHHQDLNRLVDAWRRPDTVIVNEPWWTPTAQWADIVFPATTSFERTDICASSHDPYAHLMQQAIPPQFDARSDYEIFAGLADKLGFADKFTQGKGEMEWLQDLWSRSNERAKAQGFELPDFDEFLEKGSYQIPPKARSGDWLEGFRLDAAKHPLSTPSGKIEIFSTIIEGFGYADCPGHAVWLEPFERLGGAGNDKFPLHLISPQPKRRLHSQYDQSAYSQAGKIQGREPLTLHPSAAAKRNIQAGDLLRVFNDRGACIVGAVISENIKEDVVILPTGAWFAPSANMAGLEMNGNPNVLTKDKGTSSLAQGPSAHTCLVEVVKLSAEVLQALGVGS